MNQNFDDILSDCLDRIASGEDICACIERYPEQAEELASLLRVAKVTMQAAAASEIGGAKARILARMNERLAQTAAGDRPSESVPVRLRRFVPAFVTAPAFRPALIGFAAVFVVLIAAGGTTMASANSVPGERLYWVKTTREIVSLRLPMSDEGRANAQARLAEVRGQEIRELISKRRYFDAERVVLRLWHHINMSAEYVGIRLPDDPTQMPTKPIEVRRLPSAEGLRQLLERDESTVKVHLTALLKEAPRTHQVRIRRIIYQTDYGYRILIQAIDDRNSAVTGPLASATPFRLPAR